MVRTAAARTADEDRGADAERDQDADDVAKLDHAIIVGVVGVVVGMAPAAGIDGDDVPLRRTGGKRRRKFVEIGGGAGKARAGTPPAIPAMNASHIRAHADAGHPAR